jgi:hypothetical protein
MDHIRFLPNEIQWHILGFLANPQPRHLMADIKNFCETRHQIYDVYYTYWVVCWATTVQESWNWILNDVFILIDNDIIGLIKRSCNHDVDRMIAWINNRPCTKAKINILWGLLSLEERRTLVIRMVDNIDGFLEV